MYFLYFVLLAVLIDISSSLSISNHLSIPLTRNDTAADDINQSEHFLKHSSVNKTCHVSAPTLELVAILHRHGFRTPERTWNSDPYADQEKYWPLGWGQLFPKGKRQLYQQGKNFRQRYESFIKHYTVDSVVVNSSNVDRCHMSAGALLAGWFPPEGDQIWSKELLWQPIPIHSVPQSDDRLLVLKAPCPRYYVEKDKIDKAMIANETSADKKFFKYISKHMCENITSVRTVETYFSTLEIEELYGYKLQSWTKKVFPKEMLKKFFQSMESFTFTDYMKKMFGGPLIKDIMHKFEKKIEGEHKNKKVYLYSAHDSTIVHVWKALYFTEHLKPDFGSALIFELHKSEDDYLVKLLYKNDTSKAEPHELSIPNCPSPCKFAKLQEATKYVRSVNWDTDCKI